MSFANAAFAFGILTRFDDELLGFAFPRVAFTVAVSFAVVVVEAGAATTVEVVAVFATEPVITRKGDREDRVIRSLMGPGGIMDEGE